jgi:hypothetical protein
MIRYGGAGILYHGPWLFEDNPGMRIVFFLLPFVWFSFFPLGGFYHMDGDAICQVAYWKILFRPHLQGGIGAAQPKAGLIVLLGMAHDGSLLLFGSPDGLVRLLLALFAAMLCFAVAVVAVEMGGRWAGGAAMILMMGVLMRGVNTSQLFFLPLVFLGVWLLRGRQVWGEIVLGCAALFRIEAVGVLGLLMGRHLLRRERMGFVRTLLMVFLFVSLDLIVVYVVQGGDWSRLSTSYAAGYSYEESAAFLDPKVVLGRTFHAVASRFYRNPLSPAVILLVPAVLVLVRERAMRTYLLLWGIPLVIMAHALLAGGTIGWRYFAFVDPFVIALGVGGVFRRRLGWEPEQVGSWMTFFLVVLSLGYAVQSGCKFRENGVGAVVLDEPGSPKRDAWGFMEAPCIPPGARVLGEDDILYVLLTRMPNYFGRISTLQAFNVMPEEERARRLAGIDYIWVAKGNYPPVLPKPWHFAGTAEEGVVRRSARAVPLVGVCPALSELPLCFQGRA